MALTSLAPTNLESSDRTFPNGRTTRTIVITLLLLMQVPLHLACDRTSPEPNSSALSVLPKTVEPSRSVQRSDASLSKKVKLPPSDQPQEPGSEFRYPKAARIVAIGDLHGDFIATQKAFRLAGAIDSEDKWSGGALNVVQTGDQLDRGDDERKILDFLTRLKGEAQAAGGALIVLNGNHEAMNVQGDFRYVTPGALEAFSTMGPPSPLAVQAPAKYRSRANAFLPGGGAAQLLAQRPLIVMVGSTVFVHGGVLPAHVRYGIDRLNQETRDWMLGVDAQAPSPVVDPEGPLWTRLYGPRNLGARTCAILEETLKELGARRMVVGHSVQEKGLSASCNNQVYRIDVGLAAYYGDRQVQVLQIKGDQVEVLTAGHTP